jgi:NAD(P)-dependent dehydrogenase (short-subunit alcohol dehydrogenase family)
VEHVAGRLDGKVAIVTGAASGFGRAIALLFAREGADVVIADLDEPGGRSTVAELSANGGRAELVVGDVSEVAVATEVVSRAGSTFGPVDVLVNNAGIAQPTQFDTWNADVEEWDALLRINLRSVFICSKATIPGMIERGHGSIVNISSISGTMSIGGSAYAASKAAMRGYTQHVAEELARHNVRVNCVAPGIMRTPMSTGERMGLTAEQQDERIAFMGQLTPMGHCGSVDDIAFAALFFASDESAYISGRELVVDGAFLVRGMMTVPPGGIGAGADTGS